MHGARAGARRLRGGRNVSLGAASLSAASMGRRLTAAWGPQAQGGCVGQPCHGHRCLGFVVAGV
eukprot:836018-Lingulodinium_polyedra.AAC.1